MTMKKLYKELKTVMFLTRPNVFYQQVYSAQAWGKKPV